MFPTYQEFKSLHNDYRESRKKEHLNPTIVAICYPFFIISLLLLLGALAFLFSSSSSSNNSHKSSRKYKKVVKEGLFWDSVEYHER